MSNQVQNLNAKKPYDLEERTALFGEEIINFLKAVPESAVSRPLIS